MQMVFEKNNPEKLQLLAQQIQNLKSKMTLNMVLIKTYELKNEIERGEKNDKHKGK